MGVTTQCIELKRVNNNLKRLQCRPFGQFWVKNMIFYAFEGWWEAGSNATKITWLTLFRTNRHFSAAIFEIFSFYFLPNLAHCENWQKFQKKGRKTGKKLGTAPQNRKIHPFWSKIAISSKISKHWIFVNSWWKFMIFFPVKAETLNFNIKLFT